MRENEHVEDVNRRGRIMDRTSRRGNTERRNRVTRNPLGDGTILEGPDLRNTLKSRSTYHETDQLAPWSWWIPCNQAATYSLLRKWLQLTVDSASVVNHVGDTPYLAVSFSVLWCALCCHASSGPYSHIPGTSPCLSLQLSLTRKLNNPCHCWNGKSGMLLDNVFLASEEGERGVSTSA